MAEDRLPDDEEALDAYSTVVTTVARAVLPSVASLVVRTSRGDGSGSGSVITPDGYLLTSAHVVVGANSAEEAFTDGTTVKVDVVGCDVLSDLAVLKAHGAVPAPVAMGRAEDRAACGGSMKGGAHGRPRITLAERHVGGQGDLHPGIQQ